MYKELSCLFLAAFLALITAGQCNLAQAGDNKDSHRAGSCTLSVTLTDILGAEGARAYSQIFPPDEIQEWEIVVPGNYDPHNPPGVLIYISPTDSGRIPNTWTSVLESENLIWIAASHSGNDRAVVRRSAHAILAIQVLDHRYNIDTSRVYLAGFSGGARVSGLVAAGYPELFSGAVYIGGAEMWNQDDASIDLEAIRRNRFVFMAGSNDFNRSMARKVLAKYRDLGIANVDFILMSLKGHELPDAKQLLKALRFLDGKPK